MAYRLIPVNIYDQKENYLGCTELPFLPAIGHILAFVDKDQIIPGIQRGTITKIEIDATTDNLFLEVELAMIKILIRENITPDSVTIRLNKGKSNELD